MIVLQWEIANSVNDDGPGFGSVGWNIKRDGWAGFIKNHVVPALDWCDASGVKTAVLVHHCFGQYADPMHIDGLDYAVAAGAKWLWQEFDNKTAWKSIAGRVPLYAYVGGVQLVDRLARLSPSDLGSAIRRNLLPYVKAGFRGVFIDYAENAIPHPFYGVNANQHAPRSLDTLTLEIADAMFAERAGVEAAPRAFDAFKPLHSRNVVLQDATYRHRYDPASRHANFAALGYDRSVLTGKVWRTLPYRDDVKETIAAARAISAEGDVPCVSPQPLVRAGVKAGELLERGKE